jgi:RNA polymerase sigma-70 factor (ECF subfamily)
MTLPEIHAVHLAFICRSLRRLGVPAVAIDDAAQEVFLVVHRRLPAFEGRSSVKTWVFGIARRVARNHRAAAVWRQQPIARRILEATADPASNIAARLEAASELAEVLGKLDADKRRAFLLVDLEELTVPEAARRLAVNPNTIYSRVRAARQEVARQVAIRRPGGTKDGVVG